MPLKLVTVTSHPLNSDKSYKKSETWFDKKGNKIEYKEYKTGKVLIWERFVYDEVNRISEKVKFSGDSHNLYDYKSSIEKFTYDEHGYLITGENHTQEIAENGQKIISSYYLNGTIKNRRYYSDANICIEDTTYGKGKVTRRELYNEIGQLLEVRNFRSDGFPLKYTVNTYNDKAQLIGVKSVSKRRNQISEKDGERAGDEYLSENRVLKYDNQGLLTEDIDFPNEPNNAFADVLDSSNGYNHKYFYNTDNQLEVENLYLCGELIMVYESTYVHW